MSGFNMNLMNFSASGGRFEDSDNPPLMTSVVGRSALRKVAWRLIPFLGMLYFFAFLDRVNVGFAALTMNADLGISAAAFGLGSGIFFIGYILCEVPSNVMLERFGARSGLRAS